MQALTCLYDESWPTLQLQTAKEPYTPGWIQPSISTRFPLTTPCMQSPHMHNHLSPIFSAMYYYSVIQQVKHQLLSLRWVPYFIHSFNTYKWYAIQAISVFPFKKVSFVYMNNRSKRPSIGPSLNSWCRHILLSQDSTLPYSELWRRTIETSNKNFNTFIAP